MRVLPLLAFSLVYLHGTSLQAQSSFSGTAAQGAVRSSRPSLPRLPQARNPFEEQQQAAAKASGAPRFREIAQSSWSVQNGARRISDSVAFSYGNGRGSQLINWPENFDEALEFFNNGPGLTTASLNYRYRCNYNGANQMTEFLEEFIDQGSNWISSESRKYTYDAAGNMLRYLNMDYQNGLSNHFLYDWSYDAAGRMTSAEYSLWFNNSTAWQKQQKKTFTYTATGRPDTTWIWSWNGQSWNKSGRELYTYDNGDRVIEDVGEQLAGTTWHQVNKTMYHYNAAGLPDTIEYYGSSSPYRRYIYSYSPSGKMVLSLYQEINAGWKNKQQEIWGYDAQDDSVSHEYQQWSTATNNWTSGLILQYTYNNDHQVLSRIESNSRRTRYEYNSDALLQTVNYAFWSQNSWTESGDAHYYYESYQPTAAGPLQAEKPATLLAWPNPSGGTVRVTGRSLPGPAVLQVVDAQGRLLQSHPFRSDDGFINEQIDLSPLPAATYQLVLRNAAGSSATGISIIK